MTIRATSPALARTLRRACVSGLLIVVVGLSACTTTGPTLPPSTDDLPPTPSPVLVGVADTPSPTAAPTALATASPSPAPSFSLGPLPTDPDGLAPSGGPYAPPSAAPTEEPDGVDPRPGTTTPAPGTSGPAPTKTPTSSLVEWTGKPGKPATRIVISGLRIDLPVIAGDSRYPKCNVAQYLGRPFVSPGVAGSTYIYGHARRGMLLPMLEASKRNNGAAMIGMRVDVYTSANARFVYEIFRVKRHTNDFSLALNVKAGEHRLVVQTSEGPSGAYPKLQIAARLLDVYQATAAQAQPVARPRTCS